MCARAAHVDTGLAPLYVARLQEREEEMEKEKEEQEEQEREQGSAVPVWSR